MLPADKRKRQRQTGSTYVEALIVVGLFTFLWALGLAIGRLYTAKLASVFDARSAAWRSTGPAADGCAAPPDRLARALDALSAAPDAFHAQAVLDASAQLRTRGPARNGVRDAGNLAMLARKSAVATTTRFACNEPTPAGSSAEPLTTQRWLSTLLQRAKP